MEGLGSRGDETSCQNLVILVSDNKCLHLSRNVSQSMSAALVKTRSNDGSNVTCMAVTKITCNTAVKDAGKNFTKA